MFRAHAPPLGPCENLLCALRLLANQQTGGDSLAHTIPECLQEQSRLKFANELWRFIEVDTNEAVKIGDLEKNEAQKDALEDMGDAKERGDEYEDAADEFGFGREGGRGRETPLHPNSNPQKKDKTKKKRIGPWPGRGRGREGERQTQTPN